MNATIVKQEKIIELKNLVNKLDKKQKRISAINNEIMCFGSDDILHFKLRTKIEKYLKISKKLNNKIKEL
jgi:hypothetical protein